MIRVVLPAHLRTLAHVDGEVTLHVEGLVIKEKAPGYAGVDLNGAEECVVRRCQIDAVFGVRASRPPGARARRRPPGAGCWRARWPGWGWRWSWRSP